MTSTVTTGILFYGYLFTAPVGFIGHICSLITFLSKTLRVSSIGILFIFLTLSDALYLLIFIRDFIVISVEVSTLQNTDLCRFRTFILNFSTFTSSWVLVLIATDRLVRTRFPYRQARFCTRKVAAWSLAILCVCSALLTSHVLQPEFTFKTPGSNLCGPARSPPTCYSIFYYNTWPILQLFITYLIPICWMIFCLIGICSKVRVQATLVIASTRRENLQRQMLILMISSVTCFAITTLPSAIYRIVYFYVGDSSSNLLETNTLMDILNMNSSYNFYLHCLASRLFRETFIQRLKRFYLWCKRQRGGDNNIYSLATVARQHTLYPID
jgi:hypothetical protein